MKTKTIIIDLNIILIVFTMIFLYFAFEHYTTFEQYLMLLKVIIIVPVVNYYVDLKEKNHYLN